MIQNSLGGGTVGAQRHIPSIDLRFSYFLLFIQTLNEPAGSQRYLLEKIDNAKGATLTKITRKGTKEIGKDGLLKNT